MKGVVLALCITALCGSQTQNEAAPTSSIRGKVVDAMTGQPIRNVPVMISGAAPGQTLLSGPNGEFVANDLQPGMIDVSAQTRLPSGILGIDLNAVSLELKRGEDRNDVVVKITPQGSISGTVRDDQNEPVPNCSVQTQPATSSRLSSRINGLTQAQQTNDKGEYRIDDLTADRYFVLVNCPEAIAVQRPLEKDWDEPKESWLSVFYPDGLERSGAVAVTVMPGSEVSGIDFRLRPTAVGSLRGTLKYPPSVHPSMGVMLRLSPKNDEEGDDLWPLEQNRQIQSGAFHLRCIPPGTYALSAITFDSDAKKFSYASLDVQIEAGRTQTVELDMQPGIVIRGEVISAPDKAAAPGERRWVTLTSSKGLPNNSREAQIAQDGAFAITNLIPGKWKVSLDARTNDQTVQSIEFGGQEITGDEILISESRAGPLRITMGSSTGGSVTGTLRDVAAVIGSDSELAQRSLKVYVYPVLNGKIDPDRTPSQTTVRDKQFHVANLPPGEYFAFAVPAHILNVRPIATLMIAQSADFFIQEGASQTIIVPAFSNEMIFQAALQYLQNSAR